MEQMIGHLVEMSKTQEAMKAFAEVLQATTMSIQFNLGWMETKMDNQEKLESKVEVNQEKIQAIMEHYKWVPRIKATHLTTLQGRACIVLHGVPKGAT
jgi:hypothetical protein